MKIPDSLRQVMDDPVIGAQVVEVVRIARRFEGMRSPHELVSQELWPTIQAMRKTYADLYAYEQWGTFFTFIAVVVCLEKRPDTAHMVDLPSDVLVSMAKMGSVPAAVYYPLALAREKLDDDDRRSLEGPSARQVHADDASGS